MAARAASRGAESLGDELTRRDQHPRRRHLAQPAGLQPPDGLAEPHELGRAVVVDAGLVGDDLLLHIRCREAEFDSHHALARRVLEVLQHALVARVVGHDKAEAGRGVERQPEPLDRKLPPVIGQRMQHDRGVLAGLDDLVEIADRAVPHRTGERTVDPFGVAAAQQEASDEIGGGQVVMAGDGDERPVEIVRHRLDEPGLAASGRALENNRQPLTCRPP